jgi:hypothetical protein
MIHSSCAQFQDIDFHDRPFVENAGMQLLCQSCIGNSFTGPPSWPVSSGIGCSGRRAPIHEQLAQILPLAGDLLLRTCSLCETLPPPRHVCCNNRPQLQLALAATTANLLANRPTEACDASFMNNVPDPLPERGYFVRWPRLMK